MPPVPPFVNGMTKVLLKVRSSITIENVYSRKYDLPRRHQYHRIADDGHEMEVASQLLLLFHAVHILSVSRGSSLL